jgi:hypothetical protein
MIRRKTRRQNFWWLGGLGMLIVLAIVSPNINPLGAVLLIGALTIGAMGTFFDLTDSQKAVQSIQERISRSRSGQSLEAIEAESRAKNRPQYRPTTIRLTDIGIIATQTGEQGISMRRARLVSKDDDALRPFITLHIPPSMADRQATIRFEMSDQAGNDQFIHEMRVFLRDGAMNILAENHLPLFNNPDITGTGDWDMRIYVDGVLMGIHSFNLTLSQFERRQRLAGNRHQHDTPSDGEIYRAEKRLRAENLNVPLSLEELIRSQSDDKKQGSVK